MRKTHLCRVTDGRLEGRPQLLCTAATLSMLTGCVDTLRDELDGAYLQVTAWGEEEAVARADFTRANPDSETHIPLGSDDRLYVSSDGHLTRMVKIEEYEDPAPWGHGDLPYYRGQTPATEAGEAVSITLETDGDEDLTATGSLPEPFEITSTVPSELSRSSDVFVLTWEPAGGGTVFAANLTLDPGNQCVYLGSTVSEDTGTLLIDLQTAPGELHRECPVGFELYRCVAGTSELPRRHNGRPAIQLCQARRVEFVSSP